MTPEGRAILKRGGGDGRLTCVLQLGKGSDKYIYTRELPEGMIREEGKKEL